MPTPTHKLLGLLQITATCGTLPSGVFPPPWHCSFQLLCNMLGSSCPRAHIPVPRQNPKPWIHAMCKPRSQAGQIGLMFPFLLGRWGCSLLA